MIQNIICVIFVRSGSKTIKNKNIQLIGEFTLLEHSILMAKKLLLIQIFIYQLTQKNDFYCN